ncbi:MAG: zinc ABC transporter substrate-binding protein [Pseudomonadota bacterium]
MTSRISLLKSATALVALSLAAPIAALADSQTKVVATFSILGDMVSQVGGDHIDLTTIVGPDGDAHVYQPTPQDAAAVAEADVLIINGLEFEGWLERLVEASGFDGELVVATDGIDAIPFAEEDDHGDEHADHDDQDEHGHGEHAFEWAGVFDLEAGTYKWSFAKVGGDYADPAMKMVILEAGDIEAVEETAEEILEAEATTTAVDGDVLMASDTAYTLTFDDAKDMTVFSVEIPSSGQYTFFTEHMPFEFEADEHFFKDLAAADVEPIAQEPDTGHAHHHHGAFDPHAWQSIDNALVYVGNITAALTAADADNAAAFEANSAAYVAELTALDAEIDALMAALPEGERTVVTAHDAFGYFAQTYDMNFVAPVGVSTESEASAADVAALITQIRDEGIDAVFVEAITDNRLLEQIANETGAGIGGTIYSDALSDESGPAGTYIDMMRHNANTLAGALGS